MTLFKELRQIVRLQRLIAHRRLSTSASGIQFSSSAASNPKREPDNTNSNSESHASSSPASVAQERNPWVARIMYNTYLSLIDDRPRGYKEMQQRLQDLLKQMEEETVQAHQNTIPVALQLILKEEGMEAPQITTKRDHDFERKFYYTDAPVQFPYRLLTSMEFTDKGVITNPDPAASQPVGRFQRRRRVIPTEKEDKELKEEDEDFEWYKDYGTPNSSIPASNVPCGGCGALLHCQDASIAGYMPSERFQCLTKQDLITEICQRCYFLKEHKAALNVNISKEDYPQILSQIKDKYALVLLVVDLLDFPCSIWPEIIDIIGINRPVILVANKVDLLPQDSPKFLNQVRKSLMKSCRDIGLDQANVVHLELVSATTGYGIEKLIDAIFYRWGAKGDVYIMGCTNVGKSSLFNAFLQSDLCKIRVVDIIQRATISQWPGTTLNLLKFPMTRPSTGRKGMRAARLRDEHEVSDAAHRELRKTRVRDDRTLLSSTLIGHVGRSFVDKPKMEQVAEMNTQADPFSMPTNQPKVTQPTVANKMKSREELEKEYATSKWVFDTPGAVADNQILDQLTLPELMRTLPKQIIEPRTYLMKRGWTMFVAGLARIDYLKGVGDIRLTVFTSSQLPITIVLTEDADYVYKEGLGTVVFGVPYGDRERLAQFPPLQARDFELDGDGHKCSCGDIVISSTGWVAVTAAIGEEVILKAYTPNAKGLFYRRRSLLPYSVNLKGKRVKGTPAYNATRVFVEC